MGEVFHRIRCAGKEFTSDEWHDYCSATRNSQENIIMTQIGKYLFNDFDICLNPDVMSLVVKKGSFGYYVMMEWCECGNGLWNYGLRINMGTGGYCFGVRYADGHSEKGFPSERECKLALCDRAIDYIKPRIDDKHKCGKRLMEMVEEYRQKISRPNIVQLSLFD